MKKILLVLLVFTLIFASASAVVADYDYYAYGSDIEILNIIIDGELIEIPEEYGAMMIFNDRTMVPVRFVAEFLNFSVNWMQSERLVIFGDAIHTILFQIDSRVLIMPMTDERVIMDAPAMIYNDRSYIPIRYFAESIGIEVYWDDYTRTVHLSR